MQTAPDETEMQPLDPKIRVVWWVGGAISVLPVIVAAVLAAVVVGRTGGLLGLAAVIISIAFAVLTPILRHSRWRYAVRENDIWVRRGLLWITTTVVPFSRLQFVDTTQGPIDRMLGLSSLVLHTAATGSSTSIPGLPTAQAEALRQRLADVDPDIISV